MIKHIVHIWVIEHFSQGLDVAVKATKPLAYSFALEGLMLVKEEAGQHPFPAPFCASTNLQPPLGRLGI